MRMLQAKTEEQQEHITEIINDSFKQQGIEGLSGYANDKDITLWIPYDGGYDEVCVDIIMVEHADPEYWKNLSYFETRYVFTENRDYGLIPKYVVE